MTPENLGRFRGVKDTETGLGPWEGLVFPGGQGPGPRVSPRSSAPRASQGLQCDISVEGDSHQEWTFTLYGFDHSGKATREVMRPAAHGQADAAPVPGGRRGGAGGGASVWGSTPQGGR